MRAIRLRKPGGLERLELGGAELPPVRKGEIRVRLHASSVNYHDYFVVTGRGPTPDGRIPMSDGAGDVVEVGEEVTEFAPGDRVVSTFFPRWLGGEPTLESFSSVPGDADDGYAREEVVAPATAFTRAPAGYSHAEAATLTCAGLTAWRSLFVEATLLPGETVLVQGTGGVSIFALQFAKAAGARVIATSSSDEKLERLTALGADHVINYKRDEAWGATAKRLTGGRGVDHVVEIGGAGTLTQSIVACRLRGHIGLIGVLAGFAGEVPTAAIMTGNVRISGLTVGSREQQLAMIRAIEANGIKPVIDSSFPLEGIADAFRRQESGRHFGKICLEW
ncbi:Alcohol dehydrogenase [Cystobacter fuscus DSM 2262]|uniref:Alcohol dehydrogenase n=1 Tax=Cystobacter fuscus (strain ATCC 25194 / DSM 2262 / NBRC 100088 / M29) TaxID=1242864 RepID=S9NUV9_CYSF2|nr:NAD(P)-dependent alcohol dehydrogenase [Cystobacter fuscus]EPX55970.1 Alcohol dehydrogenase [Cystobacter fuscus DSM 2262]